MSGETFYPVTDARDAYLAKHASDRIIPRYDNINPSHYRAANGLECIDVIEAFVPDKPYRWAPLKYLLRCGKKPGQDEVQELRKAIWWIEREIASIVAKRNSSFRSDREGSETAGGST